MSAPKITPYYIITPVGELDSPHWRALMAGPDGYKIVCVALQLRGMAVRCDRGGLICHPGGEPLNLGELAAVLAVDTCWLLPVLEGPLKRSGLVGGCIDCEDGWVCLDPVVRQHFKRLEKAERVLLEGAAESPVKPILTLIGPAAGESKEEKKTRLNRNRQRGYAYRQKFGSKPDFTEYALEETLGKTLEKNPNALANAGLTQASQHTDFAHEKDALVVGDTYIDLSIKKKETTTEAPNAVAVSSASPCQTKTINPVVEQAILLLPASVRSAVTSVCSSGRVSAQDDVKVANIHWLLHELAKRGEEIEKPGALFASAVRGNYAAKNRIKKEEKELEQGMEAERKRQEAEKHAEFLCQLTAEAKAALPVGMSEIESYFNFVQSL